MRGTRNACHSGPPGSRLFFSRVDTFPVPFRQSGLSSTHSIPDATIASARHPREGTVPFHPAVNEMGAIMHTRHLAALAAALVLLAPSTAPAQAASEMYSVGSAVTGGSSSLYRVQNYGAGPAAEHRGWTGRRLTDIAISPSGATAFATSTDTLFRIDLDNGQLTPLGPTGLLGTNSLEAASDSVLFAWSFHENTIRRLTLSAGSVVSTPLVTVPFTGTDLALSPQGCDLYATTLDRKLIKVNLATLQVTVVIARLTTQSPESGFAGLDFDAEGQLYATEGQDNSGLARVHRIDLAAGTAVIVGTIAGAGELGNFGMSFLVATTP